MARILALSSRVAQGHVGLSIIVPALQALGHDVIELPTIILSNHPGHAHVAGTRIESATLTAMLQALEANGWLTGLDAILTGYLPTSAHVAFAATAVRKIRALNTSKPVTYLCDPVLGDDPKGLYIDPAAAAAIRDHLIPLADIATPNRFELSYLNSGRSSVDIQSAPDAAAYALRGPATFATSIPSTTPSETLNVMAANGSAILTCVPLRPNAPHGTGDLFSALVLSAWLTASHEKNTNQSVPSADVLAFATAGVDAVLADSHDHGQLALHALPRAGEAPLNWPTQTIGAAPHTAPQQP